MSAATCGITTGGGEPGYRSSGLRCRSALDLIAEALLQQDAVYVHDHPVVELAPMSVFRPQVSLDQLRDLVERQRAARFLLCCGYSSGQVFKIFANRRVRNPIRWGVQMSTMLSTRSFGTRITIMPEPWLGPT